MTRQKILSLLEAMKGKTFTYAKQVHFVKDYKIYDEREKVTIETNLTVFTRTFDSLPVFLTYWTELTDVKDDPRYSSPTIKKLPIKAKAPPADHPEKLQQMMMYLQNENMVFLDKALQEMKRIWST